MYYEIQSIESCEGFDLTRTIVWFWPNRADYLRSRTAPRFQEEFISDLRGTATRIVTDANGHYKLTDGTFVDPEKLDHQQKYEFERETVMLDVRAQLLGFIESFIDQRGDDILAGRLGASRVSSRIRVRDEEDRADIIRGSNVRDLIRNPRERTRAVPG